jgi:hypothetical protein
MACNDILFGPAQVTIKNFDGDSNDLIFDPDDQDGPASVNLTQQDFPLMTQASVFPCSFSHQGEEIRLQLSLNNYDIDTFAWLIRQDVITDATVTTKKKAEGVSRVGQKPTSYEVIIKPTVGNVPIANANQWITFPAGVLVNQNISMPFAKDAQTNIPIEIYALPSGANGLRYIRGDKTAVAA